jgi:hypothetical protein
MSTAQEHKAARASGNRDVSIMPKIGAVWASPISRSMKERML